MVYGVWWEEISGGGVYSWDEPGGLGERKRVRWIAGVCLGSFLARFVSTQNGRSERRERREGVGWR